jgi:23S rRNA-/tRNA-specific pseudouridylate synthase
LFSRHPDVDAVLSEAFAERRVRKTYWAIVARPAREIPRDWTPLRSFLAPGRGAGGRTIAVRSGGQPAHTDVRALEVVGDLVLVEARPLTGRTHQIRVHLADYGAPILGDALYGGETEGVKRLMLHARRLELQHPTTAQPVSIEAPAPRAFTHRFVGLGR